MEENYKVPSFERRKEELDVAVQFQAAFPGLYAFISPVDLSQGYSVTESYEIKTDEGCYTNTKRIKELAAIAFAIKSKLSTPLDGTTRLWRGNRKNEVGKNPSYTSSLIGIALPFLISYGGELSYVDVPNEKLQEYDTHKVSESMKNKEFSLDEFLLKSVRIVGYSDEESKEIISGSHSLNEIGRENVNPWLVSNL